MCLKKKVPIKTNGTGYKWAVKHGDAYYAPNTFPDRRIPYSLSEPSVAINIKDAWTSSKEAEWGFHIFNNLHEAEISKWGKLPHGLEATSVLLKVSYDKTRFTGIGTGLSMIHDYSQDEPYEIVVAEEMTIIGEVE